MDKCFYEFIENCKKRDVDINDESIEGIKDSLWKHVISLYNLKDLNYDILKEIYDFIHNLPFKEGCYKFRFPYGIERVICLMLHNV